MRGGRDVFLSRRHRKISAAVHGPFAGRLGPLLRRLPVGTYFSQSDHPTENDDDNATVLAGRSIGAAARIHRTELFALRYLQLDEALAILFSTPFLVALLSGPLLGEWVGWRRWTAIGVGFFGVLLVVRPGFGGIHPAALLTFCGAICYALYVITTRVLARTDTSETTLFYSNLVGAVAMLPIIPFVWTPPNSALVVALMVLIGALGSGGHYLLILGHRLAPASTLAPFIYTQIVWTTTLGFLVFGDLPNHWTIIGDWLWFRPAYICSTVNANWAKRSLRHRLPKRHAGR